METEIISTETIKPSSPTPDHLRIFKLSLFDQLTPPVFTRVVYFYLPPATVSTATGNAAKSQLLKSTLSQTLTHFYPFAGRIKGNSSIDCNDDGAIFVEARDRRRMADVLNAPSDEAVRKFLPLNLTDQTDSGRPLLLVQVTFFECGGMAVGLLLNHKMMDGVAISTLVTAWTAAVRRSGEAVNPPDLLAVRSLFPQKEFLANLELLSGSPEKYITKRFVFSPSSIAALKSRSAAAGHPRPPSRVESVSALLWRCATRAIRSNSETPKSSSILFQSVNLRPRLDPQLPGNSTGNCVGYYPNEASREETQNGIDLGSAVGKLKRGLIELRDGYVKRLQEEKDPSPAILGRAKLFEREDADMFTVTSWCRFPLLKADFGLGEQVWVFTPYMPFKNIFALLDTNDGEGIEACVCLRNEDMKVFEADRELLSYASSADPPVPIFLGGKKIRKNAKL